MYFGRRWSLRATRIGGAGLCLVATTAASTLITSREDRTRRASWCQESSDGSDDNAGTTWTKCVGPRPPRIESPNKLGNAIREAHKCTESYADAKDLPPVSERTAAISSNLPSSSSSSATMSPSPSSSTAHGVPKDAFMIVSYNIFAKSLSSGAIPWVLTLSKETQDRVERELAERDSDNGSLSLCSTWTDLLNGPITLEYTKHWHKNFQSGNYLQMRALWGHETLSSASDIPTSCEGLAFVDEDTIAYRANDGRRDRVARTLRGILRQHLPLDVADSVFREALALDRDVYSWTNSRGPRVFQLLTQRPWKLTDNVTIERPDVICLQEYDVHDATAVYGRSSDASSALATTAEGATSFRDAMRSAGYDGVFFNKPKYDGGLCIWWRADRFEIDIVVDGEEDEASEYQDVDASPPVVAIEESPCVPCDGSVVVSPDQKRAAVWNVDLREQWRPPSNGGEWEIMPVADRRNVGIVRLRSKETGCRIWIATAHLMTASRDNARKTACPGEVRSGEMKTIGKLLSERLRRGPETIGLVLVGDFNTPPYRFESLPGAEAGCENGFFDASSKSIEWSGVPSMSEAFADVHKWSDKTPALFCTSKNAERSEWIDFAWFSGRTLGLLAKTTHLAPETPLPSTAHPSDHLPIGVVFVPRPGV